MNLKKNTQVSDMIECVYLKVYFKMKSDSFLKKTTRKLFFTGFKFDKIKHAKSKKERPSQSYFVHTPLFLIV